MALIVLLNLLFYLLLCHSINLLAQFLGFNSLRGNLLQHNQTVLILLVIVIIFLEIDNSNEPVFKCTYEIFNQVNVFNLFPSMY